MRKNKIIKIFTFAIVAIFVFNAWASIVAAVSGDLPEFYAIANGKDMIPHWLHIVVYDGEWYIKPEDACEYGGFENYSISGKKVTFSRPYFIVGQLDPTDTRIGSDFYMYKEPFEVEYSGETVTYKGSLYLNFDSSMNTLRTIASYDSTRGVFVFEPSTVFPEEINGLCTRLMDTDRYNVETRGPLATRISGAVSSFMNLITGGETDEEAFFRAILNDPAYKDPKVLGYLKSLESVQNKYDYINSYLNVGKAYINDEIDTYTILNTLVQKKIHESSTG